MLTDAHQHLPSTYDGTYCFWVQFPAQIKCCIVSVDKVSILIKNWSGVLVNVRKKLIVPMVKDIKSVAIIAQCLELPTLEGLATYNEGLLQASLQQ